MKLSNRTEKQGGSLLSGAVCNVRRRPKKSPAQLGWDQLSEWVLP